MIEQSQVTQSTPKVQKEKFAASSKDPIVVTLEAESRFTSNVLSDLAAEDIVGRPIVMVAGLDELQECANVLQQAGSGRIFLINRDGSDVEGRVTESLLTARAIFPKPGKREPSDLLLRAGQACSAEWSSCALGDLDAPIRARAEQVGSTVEAVASAFLAAVSGISVGRFRLKARDRFVVAPTLWFGDVEPPGYGKSQGGSTIFESVRGLELEAFRAHQRAKAGGAENLPPPARVMVSDATIEAAQTVAAAQRRGILVYHDELVAFFNNMTRYQSNERSKWLSSINGEPDGIDRKGSGYTLIECWGASVWGGIQPEVLASIRGLDIDDGLGARFVWLRPQPSPLQMRPKEWSSTGLIDQVIERAFSWRLQAGANEVVGMEPKATALFEETRYRILSRARNEGRMDSWTSKLPGLILRVSGVLAMIDAAAAGEDFQTINADQTKRAIKLVDTFGAHRRRVVSELGTPSAERIAAELAGWIVRHRVTQVATFELRRGLIPGARNPEMLRKALLEMQDAGWIETPISPRNNETLPGTIRVSPAVSKFFKTTH